MIEYYIIFALATAIYHHFDVWVGVLTELCVSQPDNMIVTHRIAASISVFVLTFLLAPVIFVILVVPTKTQRFRQSLLSSMSD